MLNRIREYVDRYARWYRSTVYVHGHEDKGWECRGMYVL
jgi:hypothetical protein